MKKLYILLILLSTIFGTAGAQTLISRIDPPNWWVNMNNTELQLMVYGKNVSQYDIKINYEGVSIISVEKVENPDYVFVNLNVSKETRPGNASLMFYRNGKLEFSHPYSLLKRDENSSKRKSFTSADAIYLIMPDRFANGDPQNDSAPEMTEKSDRNNPNGRHGGDIQGIIDHLDYIKNMGFTSIWLNPFQENNLPKYSYHGYAISDYYKTDPRLGTNELYKTLSVKCKERGLKLIIDAVTNHSATTYFWSKNLPMKSWFNDYPNYKRSNFQGRVCSDPHNSVYDYKLMTDGWFDNVMADMNHKNPFVAKYLIQNTIWWVEYAKLDGIRSDTHMYNDAAFISNWAKAVLNEYPNMNIVGEVMLDRPSFTAYWQKDSKVSGNYNSNLPTLMDFPLFYTLGETFNSENPNSVHNLYNILSEDFLYSNTGNLMVVVDNHDVSRIYDIVGKDFNKYKMAVSFLATTRGIPQFYYGSEILFEGSKSNGDPDLRKDFPGGWKNDSIDAFLGKGLTKEQLEAQNFIKTLLNWRKNSDAVQNGKLVHFIPEDGVYVYFRCSDKERVMVILNNNEEDKIITTERFAEMIQGYSFGKDVLSGERLDNLLKIRVKGFSALILELK